MQKLNSEIVFINMCLCKRARVIGFCMQENFIYLFIYLVGAGMTDILSRL